METIAPPIEMDVERWLDHPLVVTAAHRAGTNDTRSLLCELHGVLTELDERFPSIPFRDILACADPTAIDRRAVQTRLLDAGVSADDAQLLVGEIEPDGFGEAEFQLARSGLSVKEIQLHHDRTETAAQNITLLRRPFTPAEIKVLALIDAKPYAPKSEIRRLSGTNLSTIRRAIRKRRYQMWLERQEALER